MSRRRTCWLLVALVVGLIVCVDGVAHANRPRKAAKAAGSEVRNAPQCPELQPILHGHITYRNATDLLPLLATFTCALGTELRGNETSACRRSGQWSHAQPTCHSIGVRAYPERSGLASLGVVSLHDEAIITGLSESSQKTHGAVGFQLCLHGQHRAFLLKEHESLTNLVPSKNHNVYIFGADGTLKRHVGMKVSRDARLKAIDFGTDSSVLKGLKAAALKKRETNDNVIGFSVARGSSFRASLLGWASLPLKESKRRHSFIFRAEVEEQVTELGCYQGSKKGRSALRASTTMPPATTIKSARLVCASIAREKGHRYFAISERNCTSGNSVPTKFGKVPLGVGEGAAKYACAMSASTAVKLGVSIHDAPLLIGAGAQKGAFHTFELARAILKTPDLFNGGFEEDDYLTPYHARSKKSRSGKQSVVVGGKDFPLQDWTVDQLDGEVGLATYGSDQLVNHTAFEGRNVVYFQNGGSITQTLIGLIPGRRYTLRFAETFRRGQAAGMTLQVKLGEQYVLYQNPFVSIPLWTKRRVNFRAPGMSANLTFVALSSTLPGADIAFRPDAAILLDAVSVQRRSFAGVKVGLVARSNHGRVGSFGAAHPDLLAAFGYVVKQQAELGQGGIGFKLENGAVTIVGKNDVAKSVSSDSSTIFLSNGTILAGVSTQTHSGYITMTHPAILRAIGRVSRVFSNSIGFSLKADQRGDGGMEVIVLSAAGFPLEKNDAYSTYFFDSGIVDLGCWAQPASGRILSTMQAIKGSPVTKQSCAVAAEKSEHDYFALASPLGVPTCFTGRSDLADKTDDIYYAAGRSSGCALRCANGKGNCGGSDSANVFRLPLYSRVSINGHVSTFPLVLSTPQHRAAQEVFDRPGVKYFSSISPVDQRVAAKLAQVESRAELLGFEPVLTNSTQLVWSHALQYHFGGTQEYAVVKYVLQAPALSVDHPATPTQWRFEGSKDGIKWTVLDRQSHVAFYTGQKRSFTLRNNLAFHFHRLVVTDNGGVGVPGFGIQGLTLYARRERVRFLKALYRFEDSAQAGWDTSFKNNDLSILGGVINGTDANLLAVFNVTQEQQEVKVGKGALKISNTADALPSYLAVDTDLTAPRGLPVRDRSFAVAFWFRVNSSADNLEKYSGVNAQRRPDQYTVLSWGDSRGDAASNHISLDSDFRAIRNSFGLGDPVGLASPVQGEEASLQDEWHHYAVSFDSVTGKHRVWLDTKLVSSRFYQNPAFSVTPERFLIGVRTLPTQTGVPGSDEFNGLLDDVAIFNGPLTTSVVADIAGGNFVSYLPLSCQGMSDEFQIESGVTWGRSPKAIKERYLRKKCFTKPISCQTLSDQYGMNPSSVGSAGYYARKAFQRQKCATWPSILQKANTFASCPANKLITKLNIFTREAALATCNLQGYDCQAFVWGGPKGDVKKGIKPFELRLCSTYLSDLEYSEGVQITTRVSKYLLHPDSKLKCGQQNLPTHTNVPTSIHARWLCDSTPGCKGYVWSGKVGAHSKGRAPTPGRVILCADLTDSKGQIFSYPGSGYEVGEKLGAYIVMNERTSQCSEYSVMGVVANVSTSLQARRECDRLDGSNGSPKCQSYSWDKNHKEVSLCSSVPQAQVGFADDSELGLITPSSCQQMSDFFDVEYGATWGFAPFEVQAMFHSQNCTTKPRTCQKLSNTFQLSPNVTKEVAATIPGDIRDLWLRHQCRTFPRIIESHYFINATYTDLQEQIDALKAKIDGLNAKILAAAASNNAAITTVDKELLLADLAAAKAAVQSQLDQLHDKQVAELEPILQRAAEFEPTLDQTKQIHEIVSGLIKTSVNGLEARRT